MYDSEEDEEQSSDYSYSNATSFEDFYNMESESKTTEDVVDPDDPRVIRALKLAEYRKKKDETELKLRHEGYYDAVLQHEVNDYELPPPLPETPSEMTGSNFGALSRKSSKALNASNSRLYSGKQATHARTGAN